ncbi:MAG: rod shape-determining protein MreD [Candidatus Rokuibacteriota bacterium]
MKLTLLAMTLGGNVAQASVVSALSVAGAVPDLPLVLTVFWALRRGPEVGCLAGFLAGLFQDVSGGGLMGVQALTKAIGGFGLGLAAGRLWAENPLVQIPALVLFTVLEGTARWALLQLFHYPAAFTPLMTDVILPQALYNGALGAAGVAAMTIAEHVRVRAAWR